MLMLEEDRQMDRFPFYIQYLFKLWAFIYFIFYNNYFFKIKMNFAINGDLSH